MKDSFVSLERNDFLKKIISNFPSTSGCYLMKSEEGEVLYVGKAKSLKSRIKSYFLPNLAIKVKRLMLRVFDIEFFITGSEYEALLLENNLIKKYNPFYNISLKDGKTYPVVRITNEEFPRVFRTRNIVKDGSLYYGPYVNLYQMDIILKAIDQMYPLRKCKEIPLRNRREPCLFYHLKRCSGPCIGKVSLESYDEKIKEVKDLLKGNLKDFKKTMTEKMWEFARSLEFEKASYIDSVLKSLEKVEFSQDVEKLLGDSSDYLALITEGEVSCLAIVQVREGKLLGKDIFFFENIMFEEESLTQFIWQYYEKNSVIPQEIYLSFPLEEEERGMLERGLKERNSLNVKIINPKLGRHSRLLNLAKENARLSLASRYKEKNALFELQTSLSLPNLPLRIEGIDIAHIDGKYPVGVVVSFWEGKSDKKFYRLYNLKSLDGRIDDYKSIKEVIARHYSKAEKLPDLLLIDGGKGQLSSAHSILSELGFNFPLASLAKREEEVFIIGEKQPLIFPKGNRALAILQAVRDESHRFSTKQNRRLMGKRFSTLPIEEIEGIGKVRAKNILIAFPSWESLQEATLEEIQRKTSLPLSLAGNLLSWIKKRSEEEKVLELDFRREEDSL